MKLYRAKLKSRKRIMAEIPREQQGWWADVCAGQTLTLRDATEADVARCSINEGQTRDPADYFCEACERGSLVRRIAVETFTEIPDRRTAPVSAPIVEDFSEIPLPPHAGMIDFVDEFGKLSHKRGYTVEQVERIIAPYAARVRQLERELAERKTASIDTDEFRALAMAWSDAATECWPSKTLECWNALIAYIDGRTAGIAPEQRNIVNVERFSDQSAKVTFCSARACSSFIKQIAAAPTPTEDAK